MLYPMQKELGPYLLPFVLWRPIENARVWRVFKAVEDATDRTQKIPFKFFLYFSAKFVFRFNVYFQDLEANCNAITKCLEDKFDDDSSSDEQFGNRISKRRRTVDEMETETLWNFSDFLNYLLILTCTFLYLIPF